MRRSSAASLQATLPVHLAQTPKKPKRLCSLTSLPDDVGLCIVGFLSVKDRASFALCDKQRSMWVSRALLDKVVKVSASEPYYLTRP